MKALYIGNTTGVTDWKDCVGHSIRTDGCIFFLCTAGMTDVSENKQKKQLHRNDLLDTTTEKLVFIHSVSDEL